jgi:hypothetical protein
MNKLDNETLLELVEVDFDKIKFEKESDGGVSIVFTDESEKIKLENIALRAFKVKKDTVKAREKNLVKLIEILLNEAFRSLGDEDVQV